MSVCNKSYNLEIIPDVGPVFALLSSWKKLYLVLQMHASAADISETVHITTKRFLKLIICFYVLLIYLL